MFLGWRHLTSKCAVIQCHLRFYVSYVFNKQLFLVVTHGTYTVVHFSNFCTLLYIYRVALLCSSMWSIQIGLLGCLTSGSCDAHRVPSPSTPPCRIVRGGAMLRHAPCLAQDVILGRHGRGMCYSTLWLIHVSVCFLPVMGAASRSDGCAFPHLSCQSDTGRDLRSRRTHIRHYSLLHFL